MDGEYVTDLDSVLTAADLIYSVKILFGLQRRYTQSISVEFADL